MKQLDLFAATSTFPAVPVPTTPETPAVPADRIRAGHWYYIMLGFGGCDSRHIAAVEPDGRTDGGNGMFRMFGRNGAMMEQLNAARSWIAIDEDGKEFHISANDLDGIGIGHIEEAFDYAPLLTPDRLAEFRERRKVLDAQEAAAKAKADAEFKAEVSRLLAAPEFAMLPCRPATCDTEVAKNIRAELSARYPGFRFSVRKGGYSSLHVEWADGPSYDEVSAICDRYEPAKTRRPDDYIEEDATPFNAAFGDCHYVFANRFVSSDESKKLREENYAAWRKASYYTPPSAKPAREAPAQNAGEVSPVSGVVVSENMAKGGLEIKFPCRPNAAVLVSLKANGWRWSKFGGC